MVRSARQPASATGAVRRIVAARPDVLAALLVVLVAAGLRVAFFPGAPVFLHGDTYQYYRPAADLATGDNFDLPLKRPPLYPAFMALVWVGLGEHPINVVAAQHALGVGTALLAFGIGRLTFGRAVGLLAGLVSAVASGMLVYEHYLLTEALFAFLLTLGVFLYVLGLRRGGLWWYAGAGLVVALATLTRVHAQILLLVAPVVALLCCRGWRQEVRGTLVAVVVASAVLVPWMARNQAVHGEFTVAGRAGQSLIYRTLVHNPGAFVFYDREDPPQDEDNNLEQARKYIQRQADEKVRNPSSNVLGITIHAWLMKELEIDEGEANQLMQRVALDAIRDRPLTYVQIVVRDATRLFLAEPESFDHHWQAHQRLLRDRDNQPPRPLRSFVGPPSPEQERAYPFTERLASLYQSTWLGPIVPVLALVGLAAAALTPAWRPALAPALTVVFLHAASLAVIGLSERYRQPTESLVHVLAFGGLLVLARAAYGRFGRRHPDEGERAEAGAETGPAGVGATAH